MNLSLKVIGAVVFVALMFVVFCPVANSATMREIATDNTSYIAMHTLTGDHVTILPSGEDRVIEMTAEQVCAADNVTSVTIQREINDRTTTECK